MSEPSPQAVRRSITLNDPVVFGLLVVGATLVAYLPALASGYIWDDELHLTGNPFLRDAAGLLRIWIPGSMPQYYPLVFSSFWLEYQLWGLEPLGYHLVNVLLHATNALLVWRLVLHLRLAPPIALLIGAVFALHPVHVESVAWISERKNVLSGMFYLLAAIAYLRFDRLRFGPADSQGDAFPSRMPAGTWYLASLALFVLALLSKSVTCSLPAALILMLLHLRATMSFRRLAPLIPMFAIGLMFALNTARMEQGEVGASGPDFAFTFAERVLIATRALLFYPAKLLWPADLVFTYPRWHIDSGDWWQYGSVVAVAAISAIALVAYRRGHRSVPLALAFFAGTVFPAIGFINIYPMLFSFVADHFQYLASLGILSIAVSGLARVAGDARRLAWIALPLLLVLATLSFRQARMYHDEETLYRETIADNPDAWMAHNNLAGLTLYKAERAQREGDAAAVAGHAETAVAFARKSLSLKSNHAQIHLHLSEGLRLLGRRDEALVEVRRAAELTPDQPNLHWAVARLLKELGRPAEAIDAYRAALAVAPGHLAANSDLALTLVELGRYDESVAPVDATLAAMADASGAALAMAGRYEQGSRLDLAARYYRRAVDLARTDAESMQAAFQCARFLVLAPEPALRDAPEAVRLAERAASLSGGANPFPLALLAEAYAQAGRNGEAVRTAEKALEIARQLPNEATLVNDLEKSLPGYRAAAAGQPPGGS